jgi:hypothetical protein
MCQSRSTIFPGILFFVLFKPRDMQEYIFMLNIALNLTDLKESYIPTPNALVRKQYG